jgi:hypothetical protein
MPIGEKSLDALFEAFTQGGDWSIRTTNYVEFEPHPNHHAVDRRCVEERLGALLPWEKDLLQSLLTPHGAADPLEEPQSDKTHLVGPNGIQRDRYSIHTTLGITLRNVDLNPRNQEKRPNP